MLAISKNRLDAIQSSNFALRELDMNFHRIGLAHQFADPGDQWRPHVDIDLGRRKNDDLLRSVADGPLSGLFAFAGDKWKMIIRFESSSFRQCQHQFWQELESGFIDFATMTDFDDQYNFV